MNSEYYQDQPLRVGIVGANPKRGWAKEAHVPALQKLSGLKLTCVAARSEESARAAAEAFGAEHWFDDAFALVRSDHVDIVTICVETGANRRQKGESPGKRFFCTRRPFEVAFSLTAMPGHVTVGNNGQPTPALTSASDEIGTEVSTTCRSRSTSR